MTKYKEYLQRMLAVEKNLFARFSVVHDNYSLNQNIHQQEFNEIGKAVLQKIREWEGKLCRQSEIGGYGSYTSSLAEKFQNEVRKKFPLIDNIGIVSKKEPPAFFLKKIRV